MSTRPEDLELGRLARIRTEHEARKARILQSAEAEGIEFLADLERKASTRDFWDTAPSVKDQLLPHLRQFGIK